MTEPLTLDPPDLEDMGPDESAPFGYMIDRATGERRAKKRPGKQAPAPPPELAELRTDQEPPPEDRAPGPVKRLRRGRRGRAGRSPAAAEPEAPAPPFRAGPIAKGVNKLYVRAGKILRVMDADVGQAVIASTRKESDDDVTVGEAWEELARTNPRIRTVLLKMIAGGAWGQLFMAHLPILLAIMLKDAVRKHLPFQKIIESLMAPDDDGTPSEVSDALGGLQAGDIGQMMAVIQQQMMDSMGRRGPVNVDRATGQPEAA